MRALRKTSAVVGCALVATAVFVFAIPKLVHQRLLAAVVVRNRDMGIPGVTKTYEATLENRGLAPVNITRCDFVDDAGGRGTEVAYAVQRWDEGRDQWETVVQVDKSEFCKPYPLGIVKARTVHGLVWPGQILSAGEEATAARSGFAVGDQARFLIFLYEAGDYSSSIATPSFRIDEQPQTNVSLRVRH